MSKKAKLEYLLEIRERYLKSDKQEKKKILDEFCQICGYNRKYAIRLLNKPPSSSKENKRHKCGPKPKYNNSNVQEFIKMLWKRTNLLCSKRLKAIIPLWLPWYSKLIGEEEKELLLKISPSTIDRF